MMATQLVRGVRGATSAEANTAEAIGRATRELVRRIMIENDIAPDDIASIIFSVSEDLNAAFPAEAARTLGLHRVPLLCTREINVPGSLPRCIRVLMHINTSAPQEAIHHVYLGDARTLRPDLPETTDGPTTGNGSDDGLRSAAPEEQANREAHDGLRSAAPEEQANREAHDGLRSAAPQEQAIRGADNGLRNALSQGPAIRGAGDSDDGVGGVDGVRGVGRVDGVRGVGGVDGVRGAGGVDGVRGVGGLDGQHPGGPKPRPATDAIDPYVPGMSVEAVREKFALTDIIKLASNENPLGPSPRAVERLQDALTTVHSYPDGAAGRLVQALSHRFGLSEPHFIVGNGSDGVIKMIAEAYLEPGDDIVCADPTFSQYAFGATLMGAAVHTVPLTTDMQHDLAAMADRIGPRTKAVFVCNPNNPTGTTVSKADFESFLEQVPSDVLIVVDEAYAEYTTPEHLFGLDAVQSGDPRVIVLRTFSKIYGLAGLRVGFGVGHPSIIATIRRVQEPFQVNSLAQLAAEAALADEEHVRRSVALNDAGKQFFYQRLEELQLRYIPTEANFVFFDVGRASREVFMQLLRQGIIVRGGDAFGQSTFIRATIGTHEQNERLFDALHRVLRENDTPENDTPENDTPENDTPENDVPARAGTTGYEKGEPTR